MKDEVASQAKKCFGESKHWGRASPPFSSLTHTPLFSYTQLTQKQVMTISLSPMVSLSFRHPLSKSPYGDDGLGGPLAFESAGELDLCNFNEG